MQITSANIRPWARSAGYVASGACPHGLDGFMHDEDCFRCPTCDDWHTAEDAAMVPTRDGYEREPECHWCRFGYIKPASAALPRLDRMRAELAQRRQGAA